MEIVVLILIGIAAGLTITFRRRRNLSRSWHCDRVIGTVSCQVVLEAGPWAGKTVTITGLPERGANVYTTARGYVVPKGHYEVVALDNARSSAIAYWEPDEK